MQKPIKRLIVFLTVLISFSSQATTYYFSSSSGNDVNSPTQAQNPATPWKTLDRLNALVTKQAITTVSGTAIAPVTPGDQFLLKRDDVWRGRLTPTISGSAGKYYVLGNYGIGALPKITALQVITGWTQSGSIYSVSFNPTLGFYRPRMLFVDGDDKDLGRWPNASSTAPYGYLKENSFTQTSRTASPSWTEITDNSWGTYNPPTTDFTGAEIAWRFNRFTFITHQIAAGEMKISSTGASVVYRLQWLQSPQANYGYFIQNHKSVLDVNNEWAFDATANKVYIYLTTAPGTHTIEMPAYDDPAAFVGLTYWTIDGIQFDGGNSNSLKTQDGDHYIIQNCLVTNAGDAALQTKSTDNVIIKNTTIVNAYHYGFQVRGGNYISFSRSTIRDVDKTLGMGNGGNTGGSGMDIAGSNVTIDSSRIANTSYAGINLNDYSNFLAQYNIIDSPTQRIDDGGAFYSVNQQGYSDHLWNTNNRVFRNNIVKNVVAGKPYIGTFQTNNQTLTMYADQYTHNTKYEGNIILDGWVGFYSNNPMSDSVINNWLFNQKSYGLQISDKHTDTAIVGNYVKGNVWFTDQTSGSSIFIAKTNTGTIKGYGVFDNNYVIRPYNASEPFKAQIAGTSTPYFLPGWRSTYGFETQGAITPKALSSSTQPSATNTKILWNETFDPQTYSLDNKTWVGAKGTAYNTNFITLQPFTAEALVATGTVTQNPSPPTPTPPPPTPGVMRFKKLKFSKISFQ